MKKITKLVAVSAAAMTFGITGISALNNTNVVSADNASDLSNLNNQIQGIKDDNSIGSAEVENFFNFGIGRDAQNVSTAASDIQSGATSNFKNTLHSEDITLGNGEKADQSQVQEDLANAQGNNVDDGPSASKVASLGKATEKVLADYYGNNQTATPNANKQTANNDNKQNANNANAQKANNKANVQNNSSNKKADVVANANNNAKNDNAQGAVANKQNTNNKANAQQNTVKSNANVEAPKTVANENESNSAKNQNNGAIAETQNENTTAAGETSTVVKAQAKSASTSVAQKNNTPVFPQTGEQTSEILAVAGGLIIAATAAGIVVYKKRN